MYVSWSGSSAKYAESGKEIPSKKSQQENEFKFKPLGHGLQDFPAILEAVKKSNIKYVIYEKDAWYDADPFAEAKASIDYLKSLGI